MPSWIAEGVAPTQGQPLTGMQSGGRILFLFDTG
jgi:hypothetical protein